MASLEYARKIPRNLHAELERTNHPRAWNREAMRLNDMRHPGEKSDCAGFATDRTSPLSQHRAGVEVTLPAIRGQSPRSRDLAHHSASRPYTSGGG